MSRQWNGSVKLVWGLACLVGCAAPAPTRTGSTVAELDAFWREVSRSVTEWNVDAQLATYHPDAISVRSVDGDADAYTTLLMRELFAAIRADTAASNHPPVNPGLEFRFSSRVHDASTAHEVGLYHFWADGRPHFYGTVDSYLVRKDGRWMILVEIQRGPEATEAEWNALLD